MKSNLRKTRIICTIGPASENILEEMLMAGMNVARINFSHGGKEEQQEKVERFKAIREKLNISASLMLDTQGPDIRTGMFKEEIKDGVSLKDGDNIILTGRDVICDGKTFSITYKELAKDIEVGTMILVDDGLMQLEVKDIQDLDIYAQVKVGGVIKQRKSINVPGVKLNMPGLKQKDIDDLLYGIEAGFDYIAASFTRNKDDVMQIRKVLDENGGKDIQIIAKIENQEGIDNIDEILECADGIMVARGDLAVEVPFEEVPYFQKLMIQKANNAGKIVVIATQMLESMTNNPRPTRAEASDVANAVYDGTSAVMLSGETAMGRYPLNCIITMSNIVKNVEEHIKSFEPSKIDNKNKYETLDEKSTYITVATAKHIGADVILAYTHTGESVQKIAGMKPTCPIFVITDNKKTYNQLALVWNVMPILIEGITDIDAIIEEGIKRLKDNNVLDKGDTVYITGGKDFIKEATRSKRIGGIAII